MTDRVVEAIDKEMEELESRLHTLSSLRQQLNQNTNAHLSHKDQRATRMNVHKSPSSTQAKERTVNETADGVQQLGLQNWVLAYVQANGPSTSRTISDAALQQGASKRNSVTQAIWKLKHTGRLTKDEHGRYVPAEQE